jgi:alpha-aminoadipic semialdehyde synthase
VLHTVSKRNKGGEIVKHSVAIRKEEKNIWERRVPLVPEHVKQLIEDKGIQFFFEPSKIRIFLDDEYEEIGAKVQHDLDEANIILGIKEMPMDQFHPGKTYMFFSHTVKGQHHNMPMLQKIMDNKCQLVDYERIMDENGRRAIFFGHYAGVAGMIDTLYSMGQRLDWEGIETPFSRVKKTIDYENLAQAKTSIREIGEAIKGDGLPDEAVPFVIGMTGYGNVSKGAQEIADLLPVEEVSPKELAGLKELDNLNHRIFKVVFKEEDMVIPRAGTGDFELQDYYKNPEKYQGVLEEYLPYITLLMNCIYWNTQYPRVVSKDYLRKRMDAGEPTMPKIVGDISCDIEGGVEATMQVTTPDAPSFTYHPDTDGITLGVEGNGIVVMAVDNLPCELPIEASTEFSTQLMKVIPMLADAKYDVDFEHCDLPPMIKDAIIVYKGELTPNYKYLEEYL